MNIDKEKYALVLSGGGGKGGYEIGVWKALKEFDILPIGAVSGTSVGALNAALFAAGNYDIAEEIWSYISNDKILTPQEFSEKDVTNAITKLLYFLSFTNVEKMNSEIKNFIKNRGGLFSREGLIEIIKTSGILENLNENSIPCYATCYNTSGKTSSFILNNENKDKIMKILLASSAIPGVFPPEEIDGIFYVDGGLPYAGDNTPVNPLYKLGFRKFIVVHLSKNINEQKSPLKKLQKNKKYYSSKYKDARFIHVFPQEDLGNFVDGTLNFSPEYAKESIDCGYKDMKKQLQVIKKYYLCCEEDEKESVITKENSILVMYDGKAPYESAKILCDYIKNMGYNTSLVNVNEYQDGQWNKIIIVGHHSSAKITMDSVTSYFDSYGMSYGFFGKICVLKAKKSELGKGIIGRKKFEKYYNIEIKKHENFAKKYGIPLKFGERDETRKSQYDLLLAKFTQSDIVKFLSTENEGID